MKNKTAQTTVSPTVEYLTDILDQMASSTLKVTGFHRPYVWKIDDVLALLESIYAAYPIGSFVFWKPDNVYDSQIYNGVEETSNTAPKYILDGYQRLFSLYNTLGLNAENQTNTWNIFFDLKMKKFIHVKEQNISIHYFPMKSLLKTVEFIKATRNILTHSEHDGEELVEQAEMLLQIFRKHRVSVTQIEGGDINDATQIFFRLNSRGVTLSKDDLTTAFKK